MLHFVGRDREAIAAFRSALDIDSTFANALAGLAISYAVSGRAQEAVFPRRIRPGPATLTWQVCCSVGARRQGK